MVANLLNWVINHIGISIFLGLLIIYVLVPYIHDVLDNKRMKEANMLTLEKTTSMNAYAIGLQAPVGFGKTTELSGIVHDKAIYLLKHIEEVIKEFQKLNYKIDYNYLHNEIDKMIIAGLNTYQIQDLLKEQAPYLFNEIHNVGTEHKSGFYMLDEYISAYIHSKTGITILSNTEFRLKLTGQLSKCYESDMLFMKDRFLSKDWVIDDYTIIIDDDGNMDTLLSSLNYQKYAKLDTGGSLYKRLIRQMHLGTVFFITTAQRLERIVKEERELIPAQINIERHCYVACDFWRTQRMIEKLLIKPLEKMEKVHLRIKYGKKKIDKSSLKPNIYKKLIYKLTILQYKLYGKGYVVYPCIIDYGSELIEPEHFDFVYSIQWCFGALNSTNFRYFQRKMLENSDKKIEDIATLDGSKTSQDVIFKKVISKRNLTSNEVF